jgi:hypothetical protein
MLDFLRPLYKAKGLEISKSSLDEDSQDDIDAWIGANTPISIKCQHRASRSGYLAWENEVKHIKHGWQDSWGLRGKARWYFLDMGDGYITIISSKNIRRLAFKSRRLLGLSERVKESQRAIGHPHIDAKLVMIPVTQIIDNASHRIEWNPDSSHTNTSGGQNV